MLQTFEPAQLEATAIFMTRKRNEDVQAPQAYGAAEIITFQISQQAQHPAHGTVSSQEPLHRHTHHSWYAVTLQTSTHAGLWHQLTT